MPRFIIVAFLLLFFLKISAQVYHYQTGKAIPVSKPGQIIWKKGVFFNYPSDYGTLVVLENPNNLRSNLINLPVIRINCTQPDSALEPIFILNGGPGESNIQTHFFFNSLLDKHDIILIGYRGVDGSVVLSGESYKNALFTDTLSITNYIDIFNKAAKKTLLNLKNQNIDLLGYCLENVISDIETIRVNQNYPKISFVAYSYGTMLAQLYEQLYPNQVQKMALIGARPLGNFRMNDTLFQQQAALMLNNFNLKNPMPDGLRIGIDDFFSVVQSDTFRLANQFNPIRFRIFLYSQFYSVKKAEELFSIIVGGFQSEKSAITNKYREFFQGYPNIDLCDIFLKKQNYYNCMDDGTVSNAVSDIIKTVNHWYTPCQPFLSDIGASKAVNPTQVPALFICAQYDIAAPLCLIKKMQGDIYVNSQIKVIDDCGHLDLLYDQKPQLDSLVYDYYQGYSIN